MSKLKGGSMDSIIESISDFVGKILAITVIGSSVLLLAGELRLASLKKASKGSVNLSAFTEKMTSMSLQGGIYGTRKKSP
jgi:hypothetical protein